jgi:hypothetical protein
MKVYSIRGVLIVKNFVKENGKVFIKYFVIGYVVGAVIHELKGRS